VSVGYSNARMNAAIYHQTTDGFTKQDWLDLAMAALDQAGCSVSLQARIEAMLPEVETEDATSERCAS
jgi:hypothetical protein